MLVVTNQGGIECAIWFLMNKVAETTIVCLEMFDVRAENQCGWHIKFIRMDRGLKFKNELWDRYCAWRGIIYTTTAPHSSAANRVAKSRNHTILDLTQKMLSDSHFSAYYWSEAAFWT